MEHDERGEELEREAEKLDEHSEQVGEEIEDARKEWESKQADPAVPGAQPQSGEDEEPAADEDTTRDEPEP